MFKWPSIPSIDAPCNELADFVELICWRQGHASATEISKVLGRLSDNNYSSGVPEEDKADARVEAAFEELERRHEACRGGYPFGIIGGELTLQHLYDATRPAHAIYKYLLLSTRLNMTSSRIHANLDGTLLLEHLSADVAKTYFGERAESLVFGTAAAGSGFREKVEQLCGLLGEGGGFRRGAPPTDAKDGKLDVVVWKSFADQLVSKLIGFGQCKTGTHYENEVTRLRPDSFIGKWLDVRFVVDPVRMFFISEALPLTSQERFNISMDAGLLFDRCRIVDFSDGVDEEVMATVREWTAAAAESNGLPGS